MTDAEAWDLYRIKIDPSVLSDDPDKANTVRMVKECHDAKSLEDGAAALAGWGDPMWCAKVIRGEMKPDQIRCPNCDGTGVV
jgi:hypothetical protein